MQGLSFVHRCLTCGLLAAKMPVFPWPHATMSAVDRGRRRRCTVYIVIRKWANAAVLADAMTEQQQEVTDLIRGVPGFVAYYATRDGDAVTTITVCNSAEGAQESTRRAREW